MATLFKGSTIRYGELERLVTAAGAALAAMAVGKGDRVALLLPNSSQSIIAAFGAWAAGAIVVPLNPLYTARELEPLLREVGCRTAVVFTPFYCVAGVPDEYQGEAVKAWVVLRAGQLGTADELRAHCRERLAPYKVPKHVVFRDELPRSLIGKVLRRELRSAEARSGEAAAAPG